MALETGDFIDDLVSTNPLGSDSPSLGDDHIRLLKKTILASFPNITGAMSATQAELNILAGITAVVQADLEILAGAAAAGVTAAEFLYLNGVTSALQTQLDAKEAADADILKADVTDNLNVGYTTDINTVTFASTITPDPKLSALHDMVVTGNLTINEILDGDEGGMVLLLKVDSGGPYSLSRGTNVEYIGTEVTSLVASTNYECRIVKWANDRTTIEVAATNA